MVLEHLAASRKHTRHTPKISANYMSRICSNWRRCSQECSCGFGLLALAVLVVFDTGGHLHVALQESVAGFARQFWSHHSLDAVVMRLSQIAGAGEGDSCTLLPGHMHSFLHCGVSGFFWQLSSHQLPDAVSMIPVQLCPLLAIRSAANVAFQPGQRHAGSHHSAFGFFSQLSSHHAPVAVSTMLLHAVTLPGFGEGLAATEGHLHAALHSSTPGVFRQLESHHSAGTWAMLLLHPAVLSSGLAASLRASLQPGQWQVAVQLFSFGVLMQVWSHHSSATLSTLLLHTAFTGSGDGSTRLIFRPGHLHASQH